MLFEFILIHVFKTYLFFETSFHLFQMSVFFTYLNTRISWGHAIKQLPRESPDLSACPWLLRLQIGCLGKFLRFYGLTNFKLKWIWRGSEGSYNDFRLWHI